MDDEHEHFLNELCAIIAEARERMTPIQREFIDIRCDEVMENSYNGFWIRYCLQEPGSLLLTKEQLQEKGREDEIRILWLLENAPFSFMEWAED